MDFQSERESWEAYTERLEHFFTSAKIVEDEKKAFTLIHQNGPSFYTLLKELSFPHNPTLLSYTDIMDVLKRHFVGVKNIYNERKIFYRASMRPYESASDWHRRLKSLSMSCDFGNYLEEILLDKFVTGFGGKVLHRLYEQDEHLNLQQALEIAQRYETDVSTFSQELQRVPNSWKNGQQKHKPKKQQGQEQQHQVQINIPTCYKCGEKGHRANVCRMRNQQLLQQEQQQGQEQQHQVQINIPTCYECGKKGHRANVCRLRNQQLLQQQQQQAQERQQQVQTNIPKCYECGKRGHLAKNCPKEDTCCVS